MSDSAHAQLLCLLIGIVKRAHDDLRRYFTPIYPLCPIAVAPALSNARPKLCAVPV